MPFENERGAFAAFRGGLEQNAQLRGEYLAATRAAVGRYNTSIYENRFVVGGVIERLTAARPCGRREFPPGLSERKRLAWTSPSRAAGRCPSKRNSPPTEADTASSTQWANRPPRGRTRQFSSRRERESATAILI